MSTRYNKKWTVSFGCYWVAMFTLVASATVRAEMCSGPNCKLASGPLEYSAITGFWLIFTTVGPLFSTADASEDSSSQHYTQAVKDDAAAYVATDGDVDGPMLEAAWRTYLKQHPKSQVSKKNFAHMVLTHSAINSKPPNHP